MYWALAFYFWERLCVWLLRNHLKSENELLEEALLDEFLQVSSEGTAVDGLVPLAVLVEEDSSTRAVKDWARSASDV